MSLLSTRWLRGVGGGVGTIDKDMLKSIGINSQINASTRAEPMRPTLVISYDDSVQEDFTLAFPVHQQHNVPGEINAISGFMLGTASYLPDEGTKLPLTVAQTQEMQDFGFEITTHGKRHLPLGKANIRMGGTLGSSKIYTGTGVAHRWTHTIPYNIVVGVADQPSVSEMNRVIGSGTDDNGVYLTIEKPLSRAYTFIRLSDDEIETEIRTSISELASMGLHAIHHTAPYSTSHYTARKIIKKYCASARRGGNGIMVPGNSDIPFPTYQLHCYIEMSNKGNAAIDAMLDEIVSTNGFGIMMEHTWRRNFDPEGLSYMFQSAKAKGIDITTRSVALKRFGNLLEIGDPYSGEEKNETAQPFYVVDRTGMVFENINSVSDIL